MMVFLKKRLLRLDEHSNFQYIIYCSVPFLFCFVME